MQTKSSSLKYKGVIKKLFRDCPKPNGWFGCFFSVDSLLYDIRLMGVTPIYVVEGMALEVVVTKQTSESGTTEYKLEYADILVRTYSEAVAYLNRSLGLPRPLVQKLYQKYKSNVLGEIVKNPSCLISFGMSPDESEAICFMIRDSRVDAELRSMFPGLANSVYARIMRHYAYTHVISRIYDNPYELYVECSIPFAKVDAFAISHGTALTDDNRIHAVLYYEYHEMNKNGNIFVGDANQLGSIDVGCVFADICSLDFIPKTMLTHCYRANSQLIISNANSVLQGLPFKNCRVDGTSFVYYPEVVDDMNYVNHLVTLYLDYLQQGIDFHEITVLSPMRRGLVGVSNLNLVLQGKLNPKYEPVSGSPQNKQLQDDLKDENWITTRGFEIPNTYCAGFNKTYTRLRIGDKVMQTTNRSDATYKMKSGDGGGDGIFNGDCAIITGFRQKQVTSRRTEQYIMIETDDDRVYEIKNVYFDELTLAYAMTIHKAQGSEWDVVILSVPASVCGMNQSFSFANRNLLFTGLTRAKKSETIIGSLYSIDRCISTLPYKRNSILPNRLTDATI